MDEFEKTRWKLADEMDTHDVEVILANKEKLNDEEKEAFADLLLQATPLSADPLEDELDKAVGDPANHVPDEESQQTSANAEGAKATPVAAEPIPDNVMTQEKMDSYLAQKRKEWDEEGKSKVEQQKEEKQIKFDVFGKDEIPEDWNAALNKFAPALLDAAEKRVLERLETQNREIEENRKKLQQTQQEVFTRFENEFSTLSKNNLIPDLTSEEGKKVKQQIIAIGDAHGKSNITDAYKLWAIIPEEHGGGLKVAGTKVDPAKAKIEAQKVAAGKIGKGQGTAAPKKSGPLDWYTVRNNNMDDLIEQRLQQPF